MGKYSAELYSDDGQNNDPPTSYFKVRFQPPITITPYMREVNGLVGMEIDHVTTTKIASVYNIWLTGAVDGERPEESHLRRIKSVADFIADILADVNKIDDLESAAWAENLQPVELNQEG